MTLTPEELEAIRKRVEAATPGPWIANLHHTYESAGRTFGTVSAQGDIVPIAAVTLGVEGCSQEAGRATASFIAHAREDIPTLLSALEAERQRADEAEVLANGLEVHWNAAQSELTTLRARVAELEGAAKLGEAFMSVWQQAQLNHQKYSATGTQENDIRFLTLGLVGEAGELANFIKKRWRDGEGHDADIKLEVADVLAYLMMVAYQFGMFPHELIQTVAHKQEVFVKKMVARDAALAPKEPGNDAG